MSVILFIVKQIQKLVPEKSRETSKTKTIKFTSKWKKRDIGLVDTMAKKSIEQEKVEYSNVHLQSLHCVVSHTEMTRLSQPCDKVVTTMSTLTRL